MDPSPDSLKQLITRFAIGLLQQQDAKQEQPVTVLNSYLKHGWEMLCAMSYRLGLTPPQSLPELVQWLHAPVEQWPQIGHAFPSLTLSGPLLENGSPSALAYRLGEPFANTYNPRLEMEDKVFSEIVAECQRLYDRALYVQVREFLNRNPVLIDWRETMMQQAGWGSTMLSLFRQCYEPIPSSCVKTLDGQQVVFRCPHCGWVLSWRRDEAVCHEDGPCANLYGDLSEFAEPLPFEEDAMARTTGGIQRYVVAPEVTVIRLYDMLTTTKWGLRCELYPELDAYDLLITFPSGGHWAVDVKDWKRPESLAMGIGAFPYLPEWDRAFYVFPDYRTGAAGYLNAFRNHWTRQKDVTPLSYTQFIRQINLELGL